MRIRQPLLASGLLFSLTAFNAGATLTPYTSAGENLVYSSVSDITWTGDGNLLGTMISNQGYNNVVNAIIAASPVIYDTPNLYDGSYGNFDGDNSRPYSGQYRLTAADFGTFRLGSTTWFGAQGFINYLNSINYAGSKLWALPSAGVNPEQANNHIGHFGQLFYNELGGTESYDIPTTANFINELGAYWLGAEWGTFDPGWAWFFGTNGGDRFPVEKINHFDVWAVSPGQVSTVPVPGAVWLFGIGLVGLLGLKRRGHALCPLRIAIGGQKSPVHPTLYVAFGCGPCESGA